MKTRIYMAAAWSFVSGAWLTLAVMAAIMGILPILIVAGFFFAYSAAFAKHGIERIL